MKQKVTAEMVFRIRPNRTGPNSHVQRIFLNEMASRGIVSAHEVSRVFTIACDGLRGLTRAYEGEGSRALTRGNASLEAHKDSREFTRVHEADDGSQGRVLMSADEATRWLTNAHERRLTKTHEGPRPFKATRLAGHEGSRGS